MDLELTDEQRELASTVGRMMKQHYDAEKRDVILKSEQGYSDEMWGRYAELGALALPFPEEVGGAGMGFGEVAVVLEELGLTYEPVYLDFGKGEQKAPEHTKYNPNGRIPTIIDHKNNDYTLWCA